MYNLDFGVLLQNRYYIWAGIKLTLEISIISSVFAFAFALFLSYFRTSKFLPFKIISRTYVEIIRNTPLLVQLYILYKGLPFVGVTLPPLICGVVALSCYSGVYISEIIRAGINSVEKEQIQAAQALGFRNFQIFRMIILPQALRIVIPPLGSQFINLVKNSSLVSFIAVTDIFYVIYQGAANDFRIFEYFILGIFVYMCFTAIISVSFSYFEKKFRIQGREVRV